MGKKLNKELPKLPGVYVFKNTDGEPIYIGKAKSLKHRVSSYFHKQKTDWKIAALVEEQASLDFILTKNETEALLLETQMIQQYKPKFNILLTSGQPFIYILFTTPSKRSENKNLPEIKIVRNKREKGTYFGPFLFKSQARRVHQYLLEKFRLTMCTKKIENGCLKYHLGICPGNCKSNFDPADYLFRIELAQEVLKKNHKEFLKRLEAKIKEHSANMDFEKAKNLHEYTSNFETIFETIRTHFTESKYATDIAAVSTPEFTSPMHNIMAHEASKDMPRAYAAQVADDIAEQLQKFFNLKSPVHTIDCFDISHFQSRSIVGSCIRFRDGKPEKNSFRRFQVRSLVEQNDYAALQEIVSRRYRNPEDIPDLVLIDGGKGQLSAVKSILPNANLISLAKREETVYGDIYPDGIKLDIQTDIGKLLIAIRDYAHHFAISYHRLKQGKEYGTPKK